MPSMARRLSPWAVISTALAVSGIAYSLFPLAHQVAPLIALSFLLGLGLGCAQPMVMAALYAASPPGRQGEVVGVRTTMLNTSTTFMPARANRSANARPIPDPAPVTTAVFPCNESIAGA